MASGYKNLLVSLISATGSFEWVFFFFLHVRSAFKIIWNLQVFEEGAVKFLSNISYIKASGGGGSL